MKILTVLILLLSLVLPAGMASQVMAPAADSVCSVVEKTGSTCCPPTSHHCCCRLSEDEPSPPPQPMAPPVSSPAAKDIGAFLPSLFILQALPRLSDSQAQSIPFNDLPGVCSGPATRLCVLRCRLLL